ncbi:hypothetical protein V2A60_007015 [Cordyceps javanica]|uniref:PAK-box/P21-Rho-binding protein n=1 Tax=Cordyceps javanica TaxID=43265 RepID=A0A545VRS3_9HYPO|nr:PAK-box/P21-Rho-binding protein [Cordyceps javanica]TQW04431.1 PAK-box/P21-Rho-binding protein [Cordyceps javanica]
MWANGSPSYYSGLSSVPTVLLRDRPAKNVDKTCASQHGRTSDTTGTSMGLAEHYQPAVEAPPSPESFRRLNTEMRLATSLRRGQGHSKAVSSSSSVTSFTGDLDQALDNIELVRRSSFNSVESNSVSREASEALHQFSKNLFHRRGRSKQESTSSGSSLYSADVPFDTAGAMKDSVLPKLFARRKPSRDEPASLQRRFQISDPFNFQHVTHTNRDNVEDTMTHGDDQSDPPQFKGRPRAATGASQHTYTNVLAETVAEHGNAADIPPPRPGLIARHTGSFQNMRRFIKSGKTADLSVPVAPTSAPANRQPPQRPPRSPPSFASEATSPSVPPRVSSRQRLYPAPIESRTSYFAERPVAGGFQRPRPFTPSSPVESLPTAPGQAFTQPVDLSAFSQEGLLGRPRTATPEPSWPLASPTIASFEAPLPDLMEDDGHTSWSSHTHTNRTSTNASLRGSKSVPMLKKLAEDQDTGLASGQCVGTSAWSEQMKMELEESVGHSPTLGRASWEDDIDYCYDHEVEADCDYQWERPSIDVAPGARMCAASQSHSGPGDELHNSPSRWSPGMPSASGIEVPELSPASQTSAVLGHEAVTPITQYVSHPVDAQFRNKCTELTVPTHLHDAQEHQFSPSLLVPQDYQRESLGADNYVVRGLKSSSLQRSSTATTESNSSVSTDSVGERHTSTNSSWTALTRHTASTSSLNKLGMSWVDEIEPLPALAATSEAEEPADSDETTPPASDDVVPDLAMVLPSPPRRAMHKSHASESVVRKSVAPMDAQQLAKPRRTRARTSSLSQAPPVGQYALFPRSSIKTHGDKI